MPKSLESIEEYWEDFRTLIFPGVSAEKLQTGKRVFYAGAHAAFNLLAGSKSNPLRLHVELRKYLDDVRAGKE